MIAGLTFQAFFCRQKSKASHGDHSEHRVVKMKTELTFGDLCALSERPLSKK